MFYTVLLLLIVYYSLKLVDFQMFNFELIIYKLYVKPSATKTKTFNSDLYFTNTLEISIIDT